MFRFFVLISSFVFVSASTRWHTSQLVLTKLYDLQKEHFDVFNNYLDLETKRLEELKSDLAVIRKWEEYIHFTYLYNHFNALKVMKQIKWQLSKVENLMNSTGSIKALKKINNHKDLSGDHVIIIHQAIRRLQRFYMISASEMAAGRHRSRNIGDEMNACECYFMLTRCYEEQDMYCVLEWGIEAYKKWKNHGQPKCVDIKKLYFYIISSSVFTGYDFRQLLKYNEVSQNSLKITEKFIHFFNMRHYDMHLLNRQTLMNTYGTYDIYYTYKPKTGLPKFRKLCKYGEPIKITTNYLKCRYQTNDSPYRILMPFKEEDIYNDLNIKIYHDVLYDEEILNFKKVFSIGMRDAQVQTANSDKLIEDDRSGQVNWAGDNEKTKLLDYRVETFSGFSTKRAEKYQIVNYGLGGHYTPHRDLLYARRHEELGDRIVTVLFYMSDVQNDGFTVFPLLDIIVPVEKGSALVWHNLNKSNGNGYYRSLHGSCPLLKGNKWIMTRWLLEEEQQLTYNWRDVHNTHPTSP